MDKDGNLDVVAAGPDALYLTYGRTDGSFASADVYEAGTSISGGVVADFNSDGIPDVLTSGNSSLYLSLGRGDGTFATAQPIASTSTGTLTSAGVLAHGDFNGDGKQDLLVVTGTAFNPQPYFLFGVGDGTFGSPVKAPAEAIYLQQDWVKDFNGDGRDDFALRYDSYRGPQSLTIYLLGQNGATTAVPTGFKTGLFAFGNIDGDSRIDLITLENDQLKVQAGRGDGSFTPAIVALTAPAYGSIVLGDFDGDGRQDIADFSTTGSSPIPMQVTNQVAIFYNNGFSSFSAPVTTRLEPQSTLVRLLAADLNGDRRDDLVFTAGDGLYISPIIHYRQGLANRTLSTENGAIAGVNYNFFAAADLNHDSRADLVAGNGDYNYPASSYTVLLNDGASGAPPVNLLPTTTTLSVTPLQLTVGDTVQATYSVANTPPAATQPYPGGSLTLTDTGNVLNVETATVFQPSPIAAPPRVVSTAGTHTLLASYSGDGLHSASSSAAVAVAVKPVSTATVLASSMNPASVGQSISFSVRITAPTSNTVRTLFEGSSITLTGLPSGPVTLPITDAARAASGGISFTLATYSTAGLAPGTYTLVAHFSGNANALPSDSGSLQQVVLAAETKTTLTSSLNPAYQSQKVRLTASVTGIGTPDGTVVFLDAGQSIGSAGLSGGVATLDIATLAVGTHTLTAHYTGSVINAPSDSNPVAQIVKPSDFSLSADPGSLSLRTGHNATIRITATATGNFNDTLLFATVDGTLPPYATAIFRQPRMALAPGSSASTSFYVDTSQLLGFYQSSVTPLHRDRLPLYALLLCLPGLIVMRRSRVRLLLLMCVSLALLPGLSGCSGHDPFATSPGDYTLTVTATSLASGQSHTLTVPLHVAP